MSLNDLGLFRMLGRRMDWLTARQTVISENVANANTPGYRPRDVESFSRLLQAGPGPTLQPVATQPGHMSGLAGPAGSADVKTDYTGDPYETSPDGNQVAIEQQLMQMTETAMDHQFATNMYRKQLGMIQMALGHGR